MKHNTIYEMSKSQIANGQFKTPFSSSSLVREVSIQQASLVIFAKSQVEN